MSAHDIRAALGLLQDDPDNERAWTDLLGAVTSNDPGFATADLRALLESARRAHEQRREWDAIARMLELEIGLAAGTPVEFAMRYEMARIVDDEMHDDARAAAAYGDLLKLRADDTSAREALDRLASRREGAAEAAERARNDAAQAGDPSRKALLLTTAGELDYRYARATKLAVATESLEEALRLDRKNVRAAAILERIHRAAEKWDDVARVVDLVATESPSKADRIAALLRLGRVYDKKLGSTERAVAAYETLLDFAPGQGEAMRFLATHYEKHEQWDHLIALYEDQLRGGGVRPGEEPGIVFQIAMVHWRMRGAPDAAEPYFDRLRRIEPAHPGMLGFFREVLVAKGDKARLVTVLTDAQRALPDGAERAAIGGEIATLAESAGNPQKAIDQYKALLRHTPGDEAARSALRRLYVQTDAHAALIELLRQDLERTPADDKAERLSILRQIAATYRDHVKSDTALVTVLGQIVALDDRDVDALRELVRVYEALGRFRDLLAQQSKLADLLDAGEEKIALYRHVARRWLEQFNNVQNATEAYEALLAAAPGDDEAMARLVELYGKRRAWAPLHALLEQQASRASGEERVALLLESAKIAAERLERPADAIATYERVLEEEPSRAEALDALEKLAERAKDFTTLARTLERRVELAAEDGARLAALQKLGAVYAERLADHTAAARTWKRVLELQPGHQKALRVLRDSYLASGDFDGLEELYGSQGDWEGLAEVLSNAADRAAEADVRVGLSFRAARVYAEVIGAPERAFRCYERVLATHPDDARAAGLLAPIYEADERWARLPALYQTLLASAETEGEKIELLRKLVDVTGHRLADRATALAWARKAYDLDPGDDGLELLEGASREARSWDEYIGVLEARLKKKKVPAAEKRALRAKLARIYGTELGRIDEAVTTYRTLVSDDPGDDESVATLDGILRGAGRTDDLRWLFEIRAERASGEARAAILSEWAALEEDVLGDAARAISLHRRVLEAEPGHDGSVRALTRLLIAAGDPAGAAEVLDASRVLATYDLRAAREMDLADLFIDALGRPESALDCSVRALEAMPDDKRALAMLERLIAVKPTRPRAAEILEAHYESTGDRRHQAQALAALLESASDPGTRLGLATKLAEIEETHLASPGRALEVVLGALADQPTELSLWDRADELAERAGRLADLADAYRSALATTPPLPDAVDADLAERAAKLHDEKLGDAASAVPWLERILGHDPADERAFVRLKQILTAQEKWGELETAYGRAIVGTTDSSRRVELLNEVALVCEEITGQVDKAIGYYERIVEAEPTHENANRALEQLYARTERHAELASLLGRKLEGASPDDAPALELRLAKISLDRLHAPETALGHVESVLRDDAGSPDARALAERILDIASLRPRAAAVLELAYDARGDHRDLVRVLGVRLETETDEAMVVELLRRIAAIADEKLGDDEAAFSALSRVVPLDPGEVPARAQLADVGRRLGKSEAVAEVLLAAEAVASDRDLKSEILLDVARLYEDVVADATRAEAIYRRALDIAGDEARLAVDPARALERIYAASGDHARLADILEREVALEDDVSRRRELLSRLGDLAEATLDDPKRAIAAHKKQLEDDPADDAALAALERLYARGEAWSDLVEVCRARADVADEPEAKRALLVKVAGTLSEKLGLLGEAIGTWRSIVDELGAEREALAALERLYEATEAHTELVEVIEEELAIAEDDASRLELLARLARTRRQYKSDWSGALDALRQSLSIQPSHAPSRAEAESLLDVFDARRDAAELLRPLYEAEADYEKLLRTLEISAEAEEDVRERLSLYERAARTAEGPLGDPARAFGYAMSAVEEAVAEPDVLEHVARAEALAAATGRFQMLVVLLRQISEEIPDGDAQLEVFVRIGELARGRLADPGVARDYYEKALAVRGDDPRVLAALESLYAEAGASAALLDILARRIDAADDAASQKELLYREARLRGETLGDAAGATAVYERILDVAIEADAVASLDRLYRAAGRFADVVSLAERQLAEGFGDAAALHVAIAEVARTELREPTRAFDELEAALAASPRHPGAVAELEALLADPSDPEVRSRAAEMLEPIYLEAADFRRVMATIEPRLETSHDPDERKSLLRRLAKLHEDQAEDFAAALAATARLLHEDVADEGTIAELERLARASGALRALADLYAAELATIGADEPATARIAARAGELYAGLGEIDLALPLYRRALAFDHDDKAVFGAIDALLVDAKRPAERAAHHRGALDHLYDPEERKAALHVVARLERDELASPDAAIDALRAVLEIDEHDATAEEALTVLYRQRERFDDLAALYDSRAEAAEDPTKAAALRLALARLERDDRGDVTAALDQYERIVTEQPFDEQAIGDLEKLTLHPAARARAIELLRPLYERRDDWTNTVALNDKRLALAEDRGEKVAILLENARLYEQRGGDLARAWSSVKAAFALDPDDGESRAELERLGAALGAWDDLAAAYEDAIPRADSLVKRDLLGALARVHDGHRDDPRQALAAWERLAELDETDPEPLDAIDQLATLLSDWATIARVLARKVELASSDEEQASLLRRLAEAKRDALGDAPGAIAAYERALELAPDDAFTVDSLAEMMEEAGDAARLVSLLERRVELAAPDEVDLRHALLVQAAGLYESRLADGPQAIARLRDALDAKPGDRAVLANIDRLLRAAELWPDLLENLKLEASMAATADERAHVRKRIAELHATKLSDPGEALETYRLVLEDGPTDDAAISAVFAIGQAEDALRATAADLLESTLRATGRHERLVDALELRLAAQTEPADRATTLRAIAGLVDDTLARPKDALEALVRALAETPDDVTLYADLARVAAASGDFARYAAALEERAAATFESTLAGELWSRLGEVAETKLSDDARAISAYLRAIEQSGETPEALEALDRLYARIGNFSKLADVLERRASLELDPRGRADLEARLAKLQVVEFGQKAQGLATLRRALEAMPDHVVAREALESLTSDPELFAEAAEALELVYRSQGDDARLAGLHEKRIEHAGTGTDRTRLRFELARLVEERLGDGPRAARTLEAALADSPFDDELVREVERLATIHDGWASAAAALGAALGRGGHDEPAAERDAWLRLATWRRDRLSDAPGAEAALLSALALDPENLEVLCAVEALRRAPGRERDLVESLRARAKLEGEHDTRQAIFREALALTEGALRDAALAETIARDWLADDATDVGALAELGRLRAAAGDHAEVLSLLERRIDATHDDAVVAELRHEAASLCRGPLGRPEAAASFFEAILESAPTDGRAASALRALYGDANEHQKLARLLERLVDVAETKSERTSLRLELARLQQGALDTKDAAVDVLRALLDDDPGQADAIAELSRLYEATGRDEDLADLLRSQIALARAEGDATAELSLSVRLATIFETKLADVPRAIATYEDVLARDPAHDGALNAVARLSESQGEWRTAAGVLETLAGKAEGEAAVALALRLADVYAKLDDEEGVRRALERGFEAERANAAVRERLALLYEKGADWTALARLRAVEADLESAPASKVRGYRAAAALHLERRDDPAAAAELLEKAAALAPNDRELLLALCDALSASGRGKDAAAALERVVAAAGTKRTKDLAVIHQRLARAYQAEGELERAMSELDLAFRIDPGSVAVLKDLGALALVTGDLERAQKTFRALLLQKLDASSPITKGEVFYFLGDIANRQGDNVKAIQMLDRALENEPGLEKAKALLTELKR